MEIKYTKAELKSEIEDHQKALKRLQDPDFRSKSKRGRLYDPMYDFDPSALIISYKKIISELKKELKKCI